MSRVKKVVYLMFFFSFLLVFSKPCLSTHFYNAPLEDLFKKCDFVFVGEVISVSRTFLGYRKSRVKIIDNIKGKNSTEMSVMYGTHWFSSQTNVPLLSEQKKYLFFVVEIDGVLQITGITGPQYYIVEDDGAVLCGDEKIQLEECLEKGRQIVSSETTDSNQTKLAP